MSNATNKTATQIRMQQEQMNLSLEAWQHKIIQDYTRHMAMITNTTAQKAMIKSMMKILVPIDTFWRNVYRFDIAVHTYADAMVVKFTFYNDESMKLEIDQKTIQDEAVVVPRCDDFEAWKAEALMRCEAGEDFYERPKAEMPGGVSSALSQVQMGQNALYQQRLNTIAQQSSMQQLGQGIAQSQPARSPMSGLLGAFGWPVSK